jgi:hypothetical protein
MTRLFDLLYYQRDKHPLTAAVSIKDDAGNWKSYSSEQMIEIGRSGSSWILQFKWQGW